MLLAALVLVSWLAALGCARGLIDRSDSRWVDGTVGLLVAVLPLGFLVAAVLQFEQCSLKWAIGEATSVKLMLHTLIASSVLHVLLPFGLAEGRLLAIAFAATNLFAIVNGLIFAALHLACVAAP